MLRDSLWEGAADARCRRQGASKGSSRGELFHAQELKRTIAGPGDQKRGERIPHLCAFTLNTASQAPFCLATASIAFTHYPVTLTGWRCLPNNVSLDEPANVQF